MVGFLFVGCCGKWQTPYVCESGCSVECTLQKQQNSIPMNSCQTGNNSYVKEKPCTKCEEESTCAKKVNVVHYVDACDGECGYPVTIRKASKCHGGQE